MRVFSRQFLTLFRPYSSVWLSEFEIFVLFLVERDGELVLWWLSVTVKKLFFMLPCENFVLIGTKKAKLRLTHCFQ